MSYDQQLADALRENRDLRAELDTARDEETRKKVEAARAALFALEELLPVDDATRVRLYALRVTFGHIAGQLITRDPPSIESDDVATCEIKSRSFSR